MHKMLDIIITTAGCYIDEMFIFVMIRRYFAENPAADHILMKAYDKNIFICHTKATTSQAEVTAKFGASHSI